MRGLRYDAATVVQTRSRTDSDLPAWGLKLRERLGFKRTAVAVARASWLSSCMPCCGPAKLTKRRLSWPDLRTPELSARQSASRRPHRDVGEPFRLALQLHSCSEMRLSSGSLVGAPPS